MASRLIPLAALFTAFSVSVACAEESDFTAIDLDNSGGLSFSEMQATAPSITTAEFAAYDADGSGDLSKDEFAAWKNNKENQE